MTVTTTANSISYAGNGTTKAFAFPYIFFAPTDLVVRLIIAATSIDVVPPPVLNGAATYDYTVTGFFADGEYASGGTVTFNTAPITGYTVSLVRAVPATQTVTLIDNTKFPATTINTEFDKLTVLAQQSAAISSVLPGGPAGGDLAGSYPNPVIKTSVALIGTPTAPTPALGDNDTSLATTAFVTATIAATPPSGIGFRQLGRIVPTAAQATVDFRTLPADIKDLQFTFDVTPTTNAADLNLRFYNASNVLITAATHNFAATQANQATVGAPASAGFTASSYIGLNYQVVLRRINNSGTQGGIRGSGTITNILAATRLKSVNFQCDYLTDDSTSWLFCTGGGSFNTAMAISGVQFYFNPGTFAAGGSIALWGSP